MLQKCSACCACGVLKVGAFLVKASQTRAFHCLFACELAVLTRSLAGRLANAICCYLALLSAQVQARPRPWDKTRAPVTLARPVRKACRVSYRPLIALTTTLGVVVPGPGWKAHLAATLAVIECHCATRPLIAQDSAFYKAPLRLAIRVCRRNASLKPHWREPLHTVHSNSTPSTRPGERTNLR